MSTSHAVALPTERAFWSFAKGVSLASRDQGWGPIKPWGTQRELIRQLFDAIRLGKRQILCNKGGQVGATTAIQLFTLFWYANIEGLQGVTVCDSDDLREYLRDQFTLMAKSLIPEVEPTEDDNVDTETQRSPFRLNNKNQIAWDNGSRLMFQTSGVKTGNRLGIGRGVAFVHCTEVALWRNPASLTYLRTRFSDKHPFRVMILESTARGLNWWYDLWEESHESTDIHRVFLGWWMREDYCLSRCSKEFKVYWDHRMTEREKTWVRELRKRYHTELKPEQWAWRRWYAQEKAAGNERLADQEMPTLPEDAFEATGHSFLGETIHQCRKTARDAGPGHCYRYEFGTSLDTSDVVETTESLAELRVWQEPITGEAYVVAAVPAHSSTPECETGVVSVWKASRDRLEQVAEYATVRSGLQTMSWAILHLLGAYSMTKRTFILEVAGPGMGVLQELQRTSNYGWGIRSIEASHLRKIVGPLRHYVWRRPDSLGSGGALQWKSDTSMQSWLLRRFRDQVDCGALVIKSADLIMECERLRSVNDGFQAVGGRSCQEHRTMAAALAIESWSRQLRPLFKAVQGEVQAQTVEQRIVGNFFAKLGVSKT